ncbi:hypothetical protein SAMN05216411_1273 [Nitrosospira multiformis]|nr:hypothetical protein SAMN05216411_1273 [Nitrosospira multiformis]
MVQPSFDVELALREASRLSVKARARLKSNFLIEDRTESGWGLVLRTEKPRGTVLKDLLATLVKACESSFDTDIAQCKPVLRVATLNSSVTSTVWFDDIAYFATISAAVEVSFYLTD